ncbi:hypothetical protein ED733_000709 [Metarhizium rileyi]|uniref:Uncharacterized protein n=1 Tax=Metarhizium rileyi (strain RCEF 4871) TaxID=1649241 RepID=A0A5C6FXL2_METRR|nr:hypothetical protein ED733_000709 [Metarhizium rileyi]
MEASPPWVRMTRPYEHTVEAMSKDGLKRKCADRADSPWNKRRRITSPPLPSSESPSPSSLSSSTSISTSRNIDLDRWSFGRSLSAILKEHNRTRLYVPPIAWTSTHLKLLLVQFNRNPQPDVCGHACRDDDCAPHKHEVLRAARQLRCENAKAQQIAMSEIMQHYNFKSHKTKCMELCYGGKNVTRVLADGVFKAHSGFRRLACINLGTIQALRKKYIQQRNPMYRKQRNMQMRNEPVAGLRDIKLRRIEPR